MNQVAQQRELVKRPDIRTMKKDLKRLREADTVKERNKIISFDTREHGGEAGKQKLFILESQKAELKEQLAKKTTEQIEQQISQITSTLDAVKKNAPIPQSPTPASTPPKQGLSEARPEKPMPPNHHQAEKHVSQKHAEQPAPAASTQSFSEPKEKPYLKNASAIAKESIAKTAPKENEQRKKFMEEVEKWAASN